MHSDLVFQVVTVDLGDKKADFYLEAESTKHHLEISTKNPANVFSYVLRNNVNEHECFWYQGWKDQASITQHMSSEHTAEHIKWVTENNIKFHVYQGNPK